MFFLFLPINAAFSRFLNHGGVLNTIGKGGSVTSKSDFLVKVAGLSDDDPQLHRLYEVLDEDNTKRTLDSTRLLTMKAAAAGLNLSRTTIWRAIKEGRIRAVEIRRGSRRVPESELRRFSRGKL
jgi:excisionase family DNA binding protein